MPHRVSVKALLPSLLIVYGPVSGLLGMVVGLKWWAQISVRHLMQDPTAVMKVPIYTGFISNLGVLLWCATAAICLLSATILPKIPRYQKLRAFFLFSGLLTTTLVFDDLFLLHERFFPDYLNISENFVYAAYGITTVVFLLRFRKTILKTDLIFLVLAFGWFGSSILIDKILPFSERSIFLEDGFKLLGIVSWFAYFSRTCSQELKKAISQPPGHPDLDYSNSVPFNQSLQKTP